MTINFNIRQRTAYLFRYYFFCFHIFLILLSPTLLYGANQNKLIGLQISTGDNSARLTLKFTQSPSYHIFTLKNPHRLIIDLPATQSIIDLNKLNWQHFLIKNIRHGKPGTSLRLVADLNGPIKFSVLTVAQKILLDVYEVSGNQDVTLRQKNISAKNIFAKNMSPKNMLLKSMSAKDNATKKIPHIRPMIVVIDPGHGGKDSGAIGKYGTQEKVVVLAIAQRLAKIINSQPNMQAVLTRNGDYFVTLPGRLKLARKGKADLFIAIHADSYFNDQSSGASVYALSQHGTTSVAARWLSDRENHSELGGVDFRELADQSLQLRSVLIDLAQTATINDSLRLGIGMLDALEEITELHYSRVEQAPFLVLKSPDIPSILVETGFLSNPKEEEKLKDPKYQNKIALALFNGIKTYCKKYYNGAH